MDLVYVILAIGVALLVLAAVVGTALKGKWGFFALGFLIPVFWYVGAIRLAKPGSWWARRFYDGAKLEEAKARFDVTMDDTYRSVRDDEAMREARYR